MTFLQRFSQATNNFASLLEELSARWPPERVITPAKQYLADVRDMISKAERHGGILDFDSNPIEGLFPHSPDQIDAPFGVDDPSFSEYALDHSVPDLDDGRSLAFVEPNLEHSNDVAGLGQPCFMFQDDERSEGIYSGLSSTSKTTPQPLSLDESVLPPTVDPRSIQLETSPYWQTTKPTVNPDNADNRQCARRLLAPRKRQASAMASASDCASPRLSDRDEHLLVALKSQLPCPVQTKKPDQPALVTHLFNGISKQAIHWDSESTRSVSENTSTVSLKDRNIQHVLAELEEIDALVKFATLARRHLLLRLAEIREQTEEEVVLDRTMRRNSTQSCGMRTVAAETMDRMVMAAYPSTAEDVTALERKQWRGKYLKQRKCIQNRLHNAKFWKEAARRFGVGMIAQFPEASPGDHL